MLRLSVQPTPAQAVSAAAEYLMSLLGTARTLMVAGGNTPLPLYAEIERRRPRLGELDTFILDEYVGVPPEHPRNCSNLLGHAVQRAWRIAPQRFYTISSLESEAERSVLRHERHVDDLGGIDVIVLGLGQNGHLGFNEPGSEPNSRARVLDLSPTSIEANRVWFGGEYAPSKGATVGLKTILEARKVLLLAFGKTKAQAVRAMVQGPLDGSCPAAYLQRHRDAQVVVDEDAAALVERKL